ncbi:TauD/TfdA family dioxygenase [Myxacorys almedinensis]|uniref:TauD/TfdA family dioxygenase n=1 Tax=Myxacorys almedinensis A TaxID=2690445 RepID=A0A8J8CMC7_9CYAN|nr:TauD/TfdA family dioxygenase [Myxacorys almedinensis]NDJ18575.1 TauD/TfdA family dioxygenase [Myxacorys almedinensis A]
MNQIPDPTTFIRQHRRKLVTSTTQLVQMQPSEQQLPLIIQPTLEGLSLAAWAKENQRLIETELLKHGGILFRNFQVLGDADFEIFMQGVSQTAMPYSYRSTPRTQVRSNVYTSTEYPADRAIPLHNEMSYARQWCLRISFYCVQPAQQGGETPIADSRRVLAQIPSSIRSRFENGVLYVRNYGGGLDLPWQEVFQTDDRAVVEKYCHQAGIAVEWWGQDQLRTRQVCQAIATHPQTGEAVWFNQAHLFHITSLGATLQTDLMQGIPVEALPRNAYYGDGTEIEPSVLEVIRSAYEQESVRFPWQAGDVLLLDNMLTAHGRCPFLGSRRVLAAMADSHSPDVLRQTNIDK